MNRKTTLPGGALAAIVLLVPGVSGATMLLDTGIPNINGPAAELSTVSWSAAEFAAQAGEDVTSLSAYVTAGDGKGKSGDSFTFDIYSAGSFINVRTGQLGAPLATATATYENDGWTTAAVNWITPGLAGTSADYWVALEVSSTSMTNGLDLPEELSNSTGTAPALGFATLSSGKFTTNGALPIGIEVTATSPVPLPPAVWLFASGLLGLGLRPRHRTP
jgi:hypothetical protein